MIRKLAATIALAAGMGAALFGAGTAAAGSIEPTLPLVAACHADGQAADFAYIDADTGELVCVVATETNASNGTPTRSNTAGKGNGQYAKAGAGTGNGQYVTQN